MQVAALTIVADEESLRRFRRISPPRGRLVLWIARRCSSCLNLRTRYAEPLLQEKIRMLNAEELRIYGKLSGDAILVETLD